MREPMTERSGVHLHYGNTITLPVVFRRRRDDWATVTIVNSRVVSKLDLPLEERCTRKIVCPSIK